ncbi:MAG: hypothetical protein AAF330_00370 [Pseudomonadota bacterium]
MNEDHSAVNEMLADFGIVDAVAYLEEVQDKVPSGFSQDPTVFVVGSVELARKKRAQKVEATGSVWPVRLK